VEPGAQGLCLLRRECRQEIVKLVSNALSRLALIVAASWILV
jgi:hypothetical protein